MEAQEFNVRLWKTEAGWKVTTTLINGKSRDVTSKLRPTYEKASEIAQSFFAEQEGAVETQPELPFVAIGEVAQNLMNEVEIARDLGLPVDEITETPEAIVDAINASMLAGDKKRGFKG